MFQSLLKAKPPITEDDFKEDFQRQVKGHDPWHVSDEDTFDDDEEEDGVDDDEEDDGVEDQDNDGDWLLEERVHFSQIVISANQKPFSEHW